MDKLYFLDPVYEPQLVQNLIQVRNKTPNEILDMAYKISTQPLDEACLSLHRLELDYYTVQVLLEELQTEHLLHKASCQKYIQDSIEYIQLLANPEIKRPTSHSNTPFKPEVCAAVYIVFLEQVKDRLSIFRDQTNTPSIIIEVDFEELKQRLTLTKSYSRKAVVELPWKKICATFTTM